jgi:hypothetical protein
MNKMVQLNPITSLDMRTQLRQMIVNDLLDLASVAHKTSDEVSQSITRRDK